MPPDSDSPAATDSRDDVDTAQDWQFSTFTRRSATVITLGVLIIGGVLLVWHLLHILLVIFAAILVAVLLRGLTNFVARHTPLSAGWALFAVGAAIVVIFAGAGVLLAPTISDQTTQIAQKLPESVDRLKHWVQQFEVGRQILSSIPSPQEFAKSSSVGWRNITSVFSNAASTATNIAFIVVVGLYLAVSPSLYKGGAIQLVPMHYRPRAADVIDTVAHQLGWWLVGRFLSMLAVAILTVIGLWTLGIPLALVLGLVAGFFSFVPIIGPIASFVPAGLMALLVGPSYVAYTLVVFLGVQAMEGYLITPLIQQRTVSLPPALILISQLVFALLIGLIGVLVATPITVVFLALINLVYIEDVLGDTTSYSDKIPHHSDDGDHDAAAADSGKESRE